MLSIKNYKLALGLSTPFEKLNGLIQGFVEGKHKLNKVLVSGPSGCGKTILVEQMCQRNNLSTIFVSGGTFAESKPGEAERKMRAHFETVKKLNRGAVIIDHIEAICPKINDSTPSHSRRMVMQMASLLEKEEFSSILVIAVTAKPTNIDPSILRAGRVENEVSIGPPSEAERKIMLKSLLAPFMEDQKLLDLVSSEGSKLTPGYILADLCSLSQKTGFSIFKKRKETTDVNLLAELRAVVAGMRPASLRGGLGVVTTEPMTMERIGGLKEIKTKLKMLIEWPLCHPEAFLRMGIPRPKGVLLFGPPGCAKTSMVKAIASMTGKSFMAVSAAELYSSLVGESEKGIAALFRRARSAAPSVLFIDEIDALVGHRGHGQMQNGVQERVLATVLVEMDGLIAPSTEGGVLVVAATNRPDLVDAALLRPGRFDHVLHVPAPDLDSRKMILETVTSQMAVASDLELDFIAENTALFSGADIQNLCQEAALYALTTDGMDVPAVRNEHFVHVLQNMKPSLSTKWLEWYKNYKPGR
ncbi:Hypothetical predicted protein [Cloeon dipterum]|uniref:AAA+ ATPase domain-containing protein n=1 Tax=Cloeon dipterum TaxID=197152 RepID=A0A8S1DN45_9INSE|nr:Hypothetical predicted protein [Cloeon dipterum]